MAKGKYEAWRTEERLMLLMNWARRGLTDEDIAKNIGISRSTLSEWKNRFPDISDALNTGAREADAVVENALFKKAVGYTVKEKYTTYKPDGTVKDEREIERVIPGDTTAMIFWLKNRMPDLWRDKLNADLSGRVEHIDRIPDEDRALMEKVVERLESYRTESIRE